MKHFVQFSTYYYSYDARNNWRSENTEWDRFRWASTSIVYVCAIIAQRCWREKECSLWAQLVLRYGSNAIGSNRAAKDRRRTPTSCHSLTKCENMYRLNEHIIIPPRWYAWHLWSVALMHIVDLDLCSDCMNEKQMCVPHRGRPHLHASLSFGVHTSRQTHRHQSLRLGPTSIAAMIDYMRRQTIFLFNVALLHISSLN